MAVVANQAGAAAGPVVESFTPLTGRVLGYVAVGAGLLLVAGALLSDPAANRGLVLFGVAICLVAWVVLIRPLVAAHMNGVVLHNMVSDTFIPWSCVEQARVLQTLQVVTSKKVYHGLGVSRSGRSMLRESRPGHATPGFFGVGSSGVFGKNYSTETQVAAERHAGGTYQAYVESRLQDLATASPNEPSTGPSAQPVVSWAALPVAALAAAVLCAVLLILPLAIPG